MYPIIFVSIIILIYWTLISIDSNIFINLFSTSIPSKEDETEALYELYQKYGQYSFRTSKEFQNILDQTINTINISKESFQITADSTIESPLTTRNLAKEMIQNFNIKELLPVLGSIPINGAKPLFGVEHQGGDAIFALACNYPKIYYQRFVGSLRKAGFFGDIVLAVSPVNKMKPGVEDYLRKSKVVAYSFEVDCEGKDNCRLKEDFLGYPDPRPYRTFANLRYALYEYWLRMHDPRAYVLILDFRDTFFQLDPFLPFGPLPSRQPHYDLHLFAENAKVKWIGKCVYNSLWVGRCFGKPMLAELKERAVICSGSTLGSVPSVSSYVRTMLQSMDSVRCWLKGIESDQGYQNVLFYKGNFTAPDGTLAILHPQGEGVVNTIGAMNGFRVPKEMKGPLDTFWGIRDSEGFILNYDGNRSACVHQWDRWYSELRRFIDERLL